MNDDTREEYARARLFIIILINFFPFFSFFHSSRAVYLTVIRWIIYFRAEIRVCEEPGIHGIGHHRWRREIIKRWERLRSCGVWSSQADVSWPMPLIDGVFSCVLWKLFDKSLVLGTSIQRNFAQEFHQTKPHHKIQSNNETIPGGSFPEKNPASHPPRSKTSAGVGGGGGLNYSIAMLDASGVHARRCELAHAWRIKAARGAGKLA